MTKLPMVCVLLLIFACAAPPRTRVQSEPPAEKAQGTSPEASPQWAAPQTSLQGTGAVGQSDTEVVLSDPGVPMRDARVSASRGTAGGAVVLWPRIIPADPQNLRTSDAKLLQDRVRVLVGQRLPGMKLDVRPAPERVCPQAGCLGVSVGVLLLHKGQGCAAVALVGGPGRSAVRLIPWVGELSIKRDRVLFRAPPESEVSIRDFVPCVDLGASLAAEEETVAAAIIQAAKTQ